MSCEKQVRKLLVLAALLGGCSSPYDPVSEGAYWLLDASDEVFAHPYVEDAKISGSDGLSPGEGRGFAVGSTILSHVIRRIKEGKQGPLRESRRFSVPAGREVVLESPAAFDLRFTATELDANRMTVDYLFSWEGRQVRASRLDLYPHCAFGFVLSKGNGRFALLLVMIGDLNPSLHDDQAVTDF